MILAAGFWSLMGLAHHWLSAAPAAVTAPEVIRRAAERDAPGPRRRSAEETGPLRRLSPSPASAIRRRS